MVMKKKDFNSRFLNRFDWHMKHEKELKRNMIIFAIRSPG